MGNKDDDFRTSCQLLGIKFTSLGKKNVGLARNFTLVCMKKGRSAK